MAWWQEFSLTVGSAAALGLLAAIARWTRKSYKQFVSMNRGLRSLRIGLLRQRRRHRRLAVRVGDVEEAIGDQAEQLADHDGRITHLEHHQGR